MKITVCFFGVVRSVDDTIASIRKNVLLSACQLGDVRVVGHLYRQTKIENSRSSEDAKIDPDQAMRIGFDRLAFEPPNPERVTRLFEELKPFGDDFGDNFASLRNLAHQLKSLETVTQMALQEQPDVVIFCRPDLRYRDSVKRTLRASLKTSVDTVWTPSWHVNGGRNDRFAVCRGDRAIKAYGMRGERAVEYCEQIGGPLNSERLLGWAIEQSGIRSRFLAARAQRVRADGRIAERDKEIPAWAHFIRHGARVTGCFDHLQSIRTGLGIRLP